MELAEVYAITYDGPEDKLRGMIVCTGESRFFEYIFQDKGLDDDVHSVVTNNTILNRYIEADQKLDLSSKPTIKKGDHIMLNGPTEDAISVYPSFSLLYYLFGVIHKIGQVSFSDCEPDMFSTLLKQHILAMDGSRMLTVHFAVFENAVEARLKVYLTEVRSRFNFSGVIAARTSAVKLLVCSSITFFKDPDDDDDKIEISPGKDTVITLARPLVAVPLGSQLIIDFVLSINDDEKMVEHTMLFDAARDGTSFDELNCSKGVIKVEVSWRSTRRKREYQPMEEDTDSEVEY